MTLCTIQNTVGVRPLVGVRRPGRPYTCGKRISSSAASMPGKVRSAFRRSLDPCENSNDSGLGFDHHTDTHNSHNGFNNNNNNNNNNLPDKLSSSSWSGGGGGSSVATKKPRLDIKLEHDDINDSYCFPDTLRTCKDSSSTTLIRTAPAGIIPSLAMNSNQTSTTGRAVPRCVPLSNRQSSSSPVALTTQLISSSRCMDVSLTIVKQPEQQHRARYQTEGSRGAVKDREGNGFPIVQLTGYYKPTTLQVFIGTDVGKVAPHMFYQACKVSGKNSTPCTEKKMEGTCVIELQLEPSKEMSATCDCVGILKERNVDVEHRFPDQLGNRSKKKSTRCRMIFRTTVTHDDGSQETLQVCSQPIVCTQPPGVPEVCKKSLTSCPASGGLELFVLGKNFLKDTKVYFQQVDDDRHIRWEQAVVPDKEYLQQTHFVCVVPPYRRPDITEPVTVRLCVVSSGKTSESHQFVYTPVNGAIPSVHVQAPSPPPSASSSSTPPSPPSPNQHQQPFFNKMIWSASTTAATSPTANNDQQELGMMPPPDSCMIPLAIRRPSLSMSTSPTPNLAALKQEFIDENSESSLIDDPIDSEQQQYRHISESSLDVHHGDSNLSMINDNSVDDLLRQQHQHNDNCMDMMIIRRNSIGCARSLITTTTTTTIPCDDNNNAMDVVNSSNSRMSADDDNNNSGISLLSCTAGFNNNNSTSSNTVAATTTALTTTDDLKVMDLRMKLPMATVADLVSSCAPSMATLHDFAVSRGPLPTQSAQSIENFLTKMESKPLITVNNKIEQATFCAAQKLLENNPNHHHHRHSMGCDTALAQSDPTANNEPVYLSSTRTFLSNIAAQNETIQHIVGKSEAAAVAEQTPTTIITTLASGSIPTNIETTAAKLDALVNSTVESHIGSPQHTDTELASQITTTQQPSSSNNTNNNVLILDNLINRNPVQTNTDVMLTSHDVMLNSSSASTSSVVGLGLVPPIVTPGSVVLNHHHHHHHQDLNNHNGTQTLSPDVILNSQISPSLMCQQPHNNSNTLLHGQDALLPATICCQQTAGGVMVDTAGGLLSVSPSQVNLLTTSSSSSTSTSAHSPIAVTLVSSEPEKVVLLKAAVDLLETQQKLSELEQNIMPPVATKSIDNNNTTTSSMLMNDIMMGTTTGAAVATTTNNNNNNDVVIPNQLDGGGSFVVQQQFQQQSTVNDDNNKDVVGNNTCKADFVIPVPVKEISNNGVVDVKNEEMIPQSFTSLTENELMNLINPSCFDQV